MSISRGLKLKSRRHHIHMNSSRAVYVNVPLWDELFIAIPVSGAHELIMNYPGPFIAHGHSLNSS